MFKRKNHIGVFIALSIIIIWSAIFWFLLHINIDFRSPLIYIFILLQTHLYTGLFITAHDAMHGTVSNNKRVNNAIGHLSAILFAYNFYHVLKPKHHLHHIYVATDKDPDYHHGKFLLWYIKFLRQYITIWQIVCMAITYNLLIFIFPKENLIAFWIVPSLLSTIQLFYFGTYLPHKGDHHADNKHKSNSLPKNHLIAFITCYFFGYHYEHHHAPGTPWWQLYKLKDDKVE